MRKTFPSSFWIQIILHFALSSQRILFVTGAARYGDEFQRSNFYTNEQGVGVEVERNPPDKGSPKRQYKERVMQGGEIEEKIEKTHAREVNHQSDLAANIEGDNVVENKLSRQNRKQVNKRFSQGFKMPNHYSDGNKDHFQIPRERVQFIDGLDYQDRMDNDKNLVILSREETRGLRQTRKSYSDSANTNWKWGFKRKQVKPDHGMKDVGIYGGGRNPYKHKDTAYIRSQQSNVMARGGHSNGDNLENENYYSAPVRQKMMPSNPKMIEQKPMLGEQKTMMGGNDMYPQANQRQDATEEHYHRGLAQQRPDSNIRLDVGASPEHVARPENIARPDRLARPGVNTLMNAQGSPQEMQYSKMNNAHRSECSPRSYNWDMGNPRIYSAPKFDNRKSDAAENGSPHVENSRLDYSRAEKPESSPQMDGQKIPINQMDSNKMDNGQTIDEQRIENGPRMDDQRNYEVPRMEQQRTNDAGTRMEEQRVESIPRVEAKYEQSNIMSYPRPCCQRHENIRNEAGQGYDNQRMEGGQRIDNLTAVNSWRDDGLQKITNAQKLKQGNQIINNNMAVPQKNGIQRMAENSPPARGNGVMSEEEIRYLVFTPAEFNPMTLRSVLGEPEKQRNQEIPYCTLEEYKMESASLRRQASENFQDKQIQYRGKGYNNDLIARGKRKNQKELKKPLVKGPKTASKAKDENLQMPMHKCTASTCCRPKCPYGLVVQTEQYDPNDSLTTMCYVDALTKPTCYPDTGIEARSTPSRLYEELRGHRPIISHFDNFPPISCKPSRCPQAKERGLRRSRPTRPMLRPLLKQKRTADLSLLSDIINEMVKANATPTATSHATMESPEEIEDEKIIEKYLTSLMEQQLNNRSKAQHHEKNAYQDGEWLGKLLAELAENKLKSRMRMIMGHQGLKLGST